MTPLRPWREVAIPHEDVLKGTFQQAEFAADISRVHAGTAGEEYQDAPLFFQRTFITEGMRLLLLSVLQRLSGRGGDPVIQLQTAFGGGKTHTMLAVYHLATHPLPSELTGISAILDEVGLTELPKARIAIIDGVKLAPNQPQIYDGHSIHTLWGELAWQLAGADGYALVAEADISGTSPGKDVLEQLLCMAAPCVILMDELVSYVRQFADKSLTGGTLSSNLSFIQALTEALKAVPTAILLASLPASEKEAGDSYGTRALDALAHTFARVHALWKPVGTEEAFEIVRRRLFTQNLSPQAVEQTCKAFTAYYTDNASYFPKETCDVNYEDRLRKAYPIHPEVFDRLYEDWSSLDNFQRTRGVLKLMAKVIHRLWEDDNKDPLIMPGNIPLYSGDALNDLVYYLPEGWNPVVERDIDGARAETRNIERNDPRLGGIQACRRLARSIFLGSAPSGNHLTPDGYKGINEAHIYLGAAMPEQHLAVYKDALMRLSDKLYYLNKDSEHYWFDTRPNLRREMEDRKNRFSQADIDKALRGYIQAFVRGGNIFANKVHVFVPHSDIPDDDTLRLVVLRPHAAHSKIPATNTPKSALHEAQTYIEKRGEQPRLYRNRLIFLAADYDHVNRLAELVRSALAWQSIADDIRDERINLDQYNIRQAREALTTAERVAKKSAEESYRWVIAPSGEEQGAIEWDTHNMTLRHNMQPMQEIERILKEYELVLDAWAPFHLDAKLKSYYWKGDKKHIKAKQVWEDFCRYLYLPRLRDKAVLQKTLESSTASRDFFATAQGQEAETYKGFVFGTVTLIVLDESLLIISHEAALEHETRVNEVEETKRAYAGFELEPPPDLHIGGGKIIGANGVRTDPNIVPQPKVNAVKRRFFGSVEIKPHTALKEMKDVVDEVLMYLIQRPNTEVKISIEMEADCSDMQGFDVNIVRTVTENATTLKFKNKGFE